MSSVAIDTAAVALCEAEPIRSPGRVQPHGCLIVFDQAGRVEAISHNAGQMLGLPCSDLGQSGAQLFSERVWCVLETALQNLVIGHRPTELSIDFELTPLAKRFELLAHRLSDVFVVEFLPRLDPFSPLQLANATEDPDNLFRRALATVEQVQAITGYDRVMLYRFQADWSGEVIAELRAPDMTPFLGLRYPATDIPSQARQLYLETAVRIIPNVRASPVGLESAGPIDLGGATLRAVSPYHLEYLRNMGVSATLTLSIIVDGQLWGMVACHHRDERYIAYQRQNAALAIVHTFEATLKEDRQRQASSDAALVQTALERWVSALKDQVHATALLSGPTSVLQDTQADGAAIVFDGQCLGLGATPEAAWLIAMAQEMRDKDQNGIKVSDCLQDLDAAPQTLATAGAMMADLGGDQPRALFVFRRAQVQEVHWGGDPRTAVQLSPKDGRPSPRTSFALWKETVLNKSAPWSMGQTAVFEACAQVLSARLIDKAACESLMQDLSKASDRLLGLADAQQALADILPCGAAVLLWTDGQTGPRLLYANRGLTELLGLSLSDIVDQSPSYVLARTQLEPRLLSLPLAVDTEVEVWSPGQGLRHMRARRETVVRRRDADGRDLTVEGLLLNDITNGRRTLDALSSAVRHAEQGDRARTALMRNMSHELRTPLNAILGYSDLMALELCGPLGQDAYREAAAEIAAGARHLLGMINDTLEMAQLYEGKLRLNEAAHDLSEIVDQCLSLMQVLAGKGQIALRRSDMLTSVMVKVDETAMRQILINLINNALKFTAAGGTVDVKLSVDDTSAVSIAVRDTGIGIASRDLSKLFKPFSQIDDQIDRKQGGNGLGLAIVKSLVQLHGAKIEVDSDPGRGSIFTVRLPAWRMECSK